MNIDKNYWETHNLDSIPPHFLNRINDIKVCQIIETNLVKMFDINKDFLEMAKESSSLFFIATYVHPCFPSIISEFVEKNVNISVVMNKDLFQICKDEWYDELKQFIISGMAKFYLYQEPIGFLSLALSDNCFVLKLFSKKNEYSYNQIFCCNPKACQWAKDLFEYYLENSTLISETWINP
ncbi:MAG: DUF1724 domain-containing protein [Methanolobus sp.]|uniref:helix-turn-helix transcriptional regulator n=1 Tax=Methanolobus sp. TaxID=1874737 RepID=UPI00272FB231|nr:transcriptional regulator FilR1 domain-containing protein [Methanolobus sp.]MDP2216408.1 DUF1724 domain-containing protein [Methanolobus sp.]